MHGEERVNVGPRIAGAPISWGVWEVPGWGYQLDADRVLGEAASVGLAAMEAGPAGFLPANPAQAADLLARYGLGLVGGFVPAVLHRPEVRPAELAAVERQAKLFASAGAEVLVLAASTGLEGYEETVELGEDAWAALFESLALVEEICARNGLSAALHPHVGTVIERRHHLTRFLAGSGMALCLDTGHLMVGGSDPLEVLELAVARVAHVHLKDVDRGLAEQVAAGALAYGEAVCRGMYRPLGEGDAQIGRVIDLLEGAGYGGWYVFEQDTALAAAPPEGEGALRDVRRSLAFLRRKLRDERATVT